MEIILKKLNTRNAEVIILLVCISFLPIIILFNYCHATGDDFGYGAVVKQAFDNTHSIIEMIRASYIQTKGVYDSWQGTWFTVFLFAFNPEVFGFKFYFLVPIVMFGLHVVAAILLIKLFIEKRYNLARKELWQITVLLLFCNIQFAPSYQCNLFWWVGTVHYVVPYFLGIIALYNSIRFLNEYYIKNLIGALVAFVFIGGGNYQIAIITPLVLLCYVLWNKVIHSRKKAAKAFLLVVPVLLEMVGLYISIIAPGNKNRGGESFGFSMHYAIGIILKCFTTAFDTAVKYCSERTFILVIFLIYAIVMYNVISNNVKCIEKNFQAPILMMIMTFCIFAASFAPELYANVGVSGGVYNTNFYIFVFGVFYIIAYVEGYLITRKGYDYANSYSLVRRVFCFILLIMLVFIGRHSLKISTAYVSYKYIVSGQAADYKEQVILQHEILSDEDITDAVVPFINNEQGPLQQMPVTGDPDAWSNSVTASFYGKNSVVAIDRDEWIQKYGSTYGY